MRSAKELSRIDRAIHTDGPVRDWLGQAIAKRWAKRAMVRLANQAKADGQRDAREIESAAYRAAQRKESGK